MTLNSIEPIVTIVDGLIADHAMLDDAAGRIPKRVTNDWWRFSAFTRSEYGAQGIAEVTDATRQDVLDADFGTTYLAGPVPVDFLFPDSRASAKDAYRYLCREHGDPALADKQTADVTMSYKGLDATAARDEREYARLAGLLGKPVPDFNAPAYAQMTRADFDIAVTAVNSATRRVQVLKDLVTDEVTAEWERVRNMNPRMLTVDTKALDALAFGPEVTEMASRYVKVPLSLLVSGYTNTTFIERYREAVAEAAVVADETARIQREERQRVQRETEMRMMRQQFDVLARSLDLG